MSKSKRYWEAQIEATEQAFLNGEIDSEQFCERLHGLGVHPYEISDTLDALKEGRERGITVCQVAEGEF